MSGGSLSYAHTMEIPESWQLERLRDELRGYAAEELPGAREALEETQKLLDLRREPQPLAEVWRCIEWNLSADYGRDQVVEALGDYARRGS